MHASTHTKKKTICFAAAAETCSLLAMDLFCRLACGSVRFTAGYGKIGSVGRIATSARVRVVLSYPKHITKLYASYVCRRDVTR